MDKVQIVKPMEVKKFPKGVIPAAFGSEILPYPETITVFKDEKENLFYDKYGTKPVTPRQ